MAGRRLDVTARHMLGSAAQEAEVPLAAAARRGAALQRPAPVLFDDTQMMEFVREGYVMLDTSDLGAEYYAGICEKLSAVIERHQNPGNNMLPMVPELSTMLQHPLVDGALKSILGTDYYVHLHRHPHFRDNVDEGEAGRVHHLHKDSMGNSRFAVDAFRRQHRTRMCMLVMFPQDTPIELGPTAIMPRSQFLLHSPQPGDQHVPYHEGEAVRMCGPHGTVGIIHYDLLHTSTNKVLDQLPRHMIKFLFSRMSEPDAGPSWRSTGTEWVASDSPQEPIWRAMWDWHCGKPEQPSWEPLPEERRGTGEERGAAAARLGEQLHSSCEHDAVRAAYALGVGLGGAEGTHVLMEALRELPPPPASEEDALSVNTERSSKFSEACSYVQAGYGLVEQGAAAVPSLLELAASDEPLLRARAIDVLGDMGPQAAKALAIPLLLDALHDPDEDARRRAAESLGTVGCGAAAQAELCVALAKCLKDPSEQVRRNAAYSLARLGPAVGGEAGEGEVVAALTVAMEDSNHYVRGLSAHALERVGTLASLKAALTRLQVTRYDANY